MDSRSGLRPHDEDEVHITFDFLCTAVQPLKSDTCVSRQHQISLEII